MMDYGDVMTTSDWPDNAMKYNGISWPTVCFDDAEAHFFTIGDALLKFSPTDVVDRELYRHVRGALWSVVSPDTDYNAQTLVASQMKVKAQELQQKGHDPRSWRAKAKCQFAIALKMLLLCTPPRFVLNVGWMGTGLLSTVEMGVQRAAWFGGSSRPRYGDETFDPDVSAGDNFYPGGINAHCDSVNTPSDSFLSWQFRQVFENMYKVEDLGNMEWWSVLGNHDYGGVCYIKGWDQQIFYTFKDGGRWIMPAQYWHRRVQFKTFDADIWFLDTNVLDTQNPADNPDHNLCANRGNSDKFQYCEKNRFPPKEGTDASHLAAPSSSHPADLGEDCTQWFDKLWGEQKKPWPSVAIAREAGIDLIISGHKHEQKVDSLAMWPFSFVRSAVPAMVSEPACKEYQAQVAAMEVSTEAAYQELARRREEVIASLGSWCQALKAIRAPQTAPLEADGDPKETSQLQSHLRDALFVEICNALAFPGAAALAKPATPTKVVSQRQVSTSAAVVSVRTPRTPQKPSPRGSRESLSSRATSLTPRPSPLSALGRKDARPVQPLVPRQRCPPTNNVPEKRPTGRIERTSERPVVTRSQQFQMPAFAGVRRSSSPRNSSQPLSARSSSLRY
ncbi:unnamed protein product [Symbiodinium microadriaticum]|nr:unnamed protein product [Symbiodinium microadriaticum]